MHRKMNISNAIKNKDQNNEKQKENTYFPQKTNIKKEIFGQTSTYKQRRPIFHKTQLGKETT